MDNKVNKSIRVPQKIFEEIQKMKFAFCASYGRQMILETNPTSIIAGMEDSDPAVYEEYCRIDSHSVE